MESDKHNKLFFFFPLQSLLLTIYQLTTSSGAGFMGQPVLKSWTYTTLNLQMAEATEALQKLPEWLSCFPALSYASSAHWAKFFVELTS